MSAQFSFDDPNSLLQQVQQILTARGTQIRAVPDHAVRKGVIVLTGMVKDLAPKKTSTFARSILGVVRQVSADIIEGRVGSPMAYARYLEEGTGIYGPRGKPFVVSAKPGKSLFWGARESFASRVSDRTKLYRTSATKSGVTTIASKGEDLLFRRRVVIQGMRARAPFARAIAAFLPRYVAIVEQELARATA